MITRKHVFLAAKLAVGALVVWLISRQITLDDEIVLADGGVVVAGRGLDVSGDVRIRGDGGEQAAPVDRASVFRRPDGTFLLETRRPGHVERFAGTSVTWDGTASLVDSAGTRRTVGLDALTVREDGEDVVRVSPAFKFGLRSILRGLKDRPAYAAAAFALMLLAYAAGIARWRLLLRAQGLFVSYLRALQLTFIGMFFNNVLPGLTGGDIVKGVMIAQDHPDRRPAAVGTVIVDRVLGLIVLALMSAAVLAFTFDRYREAAVAVFGFLVAAAVCMTLFFSRRVRAALRLSHVVKRLPGADILRKLDEAFFLYRSQGKTVLIASLLSVLSHCGNIGAIYCFGIGIGLDAAAGLEGNPILAYLATVPIIMIVSSIPLLPGGWGVGEAAFGYFFRTVGIWNLDLSIGLSVVQRTATLLLSLVGGAFFLTFRKRIMDAVHAAPEN